MRNFLLTAAVLLPGALMGQQAWAGTVTFNSNGSWGSSTCTNGCSLNGNTETIGQGGFYVGPFFIHSGPDSTLTAVDVASITTPALPVGNFRIGEIDWTNNPTANTDSSFSLNYSLQLNMTAPGTQSRTANMTFNIQQPTNPPGDSVTQLLLSSLSALDFSFSGVSVSNVRFQLDPAYNQHGATYNAATGVWYNPESNSSHMLITADFSAVPEPASMALLGTAMAGLGLIRRRKSR